MWLHSLGHGTLGYLSFGLMSLAMASGALMLLVGRYRKQLLLLHLSSSILAYVCMFLAIWVVR